MPKRADLSLRELLRQNGAVGDAAGTEPHNRARLLWESGELGQALDAAAEEEGGAARLSALVRATEALHASGDLERGAVDEVATDPVVGDSWRDAWEARCAADVNALQRCGVSAERASMSWLAAHVHAWASTVHSLAGDTDASKAAAGQALEQFDSMAMTLPPTQRATLCSELRAELKARWRTRTPETTGTNQTSGGDDAERLEALETLVDCVRELTRERTTEELLETMTRGAVRLSGAERGFVLLVDEAGELEPKTIHAVERSAGEATAMFSRSIAETVLIDKEPLVTVDAGEDKRLEQYRSVHHLMLKSVACLPVRSRDRTWGVFYLEHRSAKGRFTESDVNLLGAFANQAAIALDTARLLEETSAQRRDLEVANRALSEVNERLTGNLADERAQLQSTRRELARLREQAPGTGQRWGIVGRCAAMGRVFALVDRVAATDVPVVVSGESGTGKELIARAVHDHGPRADGPFVSVSCGAIPEALLESELFGHEAGAFTGAARARDGVFVQASGGTLFMDEVADMPSRMQVDLLRVLQDGKVRPIGSNEEREVDVRLIAASNRPLKQLVDAGKFREDLYYRMSVVEIDLPPLRQRVDDLPLLCDHLLARIAANRGMPQKKLSRDAMSRLSQHAFPGNVRELEHLLLNACVLSEGDIIDAPDLALDTTVATPQTPETFGDFKDGERDQILAALNAHQWNRARAARALGIPRRTFYRRLKEHGIELPK